MIRKAIIIAAAVMLAVSFSGSVYAASAKSVPETVSAEENEKKGSDYYKKTDENLRSAYFNAMDVIESGHAGDFRKGKSPGEWFFLIFYNAYTAVKRAAPFIVLVSVLLGSTICFFAKRNKMIFRRALIVFVIGVPLVLTAFVFGIGSMTAIFG